MTPEEFELWQWRADIGSRVKVLESDLKSDEQRRDQLVKTRSAQVSLLVSVLINLLTMFVLFFTRR